MVSLEYAKALYSLSSSLSEKQEMLNNLESSLTIFDDETSRFFNYPAISKETKKEVLKKSFPDGILLNFLNVLIDNDRFNDLESIKDEYSKLLEEELNKEKVIVYSNSKLCNEYMNKLTLKMKNKLARDVVLENVIDSSIKAGIRIIYDSKEIDLTLNTKLDNLVSSLRKE